MMMVRTSLEFVARLAGGATEPFSAGPTPLTPTVSHPPNAFSSELIQTWFFAISLAPYTGLQESFGRFGPENLKYSKKIRVPQKEVGKRSSITSFRFRDSFGHFWSLFLMLLLLFSARFCQTPFAGLLLRQGEERFLGPERLRGQKIETCREKVTTNESKTNFFNFVNLF